VGFVTSFLFLLTPLLSCLATAVSGIFFTTTCLARTGLNGVCLAGAPLIALSLAVCPYPVMKTKQNKKQINDFTQVDYGAKIYG